MYNLRGFTYLFNNQNEKALNDLKTTLVMNCDRKNSYLNIAIFYSAINDEANAIENLKQSFELGFNSFDYLEKNEYLNNIRESKAYQKLIKKYKK